MRLSRIWRTLQIKEGTCYPQKAKAEFNNCFIHSKYFLLLKGVSPLRSLFFRSPNITQPCPQIFSVNGSIICGGLHFWRHFDVIGSIIFGGLHFWRHWFNMAKILSKFGEQQLVVVNYECGFNQSEMGKYFEWIIIILSFLIRKFTWTICWCFQQGDVPVLQVSLVNRNRWWALKTSAVECW